MREVCVNWSWRRARPGRDVQNFGHDKFSRPGRTCADYSWTHAGSTLTVRQRNYAWTGREKCGSKPIIRTRCYNGEIHAKKERKKKPLWIVYAWDWGRFSDYFSLLIHLKIGPKSYVFFSNPKDLMLFLINLQIIGLYSIIMWKWSYKMS